MVNGSNETHQNPASSGLPRDEFPGPVLGLGHEVTRLQSWDCCEVLLLTK